MKIEWHPELVQRPTVDPDFQRLNGLQRAAASFRYIFLRWEHWASPDGDIREWLRHNTRIAAWLFFPAIFVMPLVGFLLWQLTGWLSMLTSIAAKLTFLPVWLLLLFISLRVVRAVLRR